MQESAILSRINEEFPPERLLETLERVDPIGVVVGPPAIVPPGQRDRARPGRRPRSGQRRPGDGRRVRTGRGGSGWIVRRGLVVTNAHVVAGISRPVIDRRGKRSVQASVVAFDAQNDIAVLRARGLRGAPLAMADPERRVPVALIGYPGNGPLTVIPGRLGGTGRALSRDAYGRGPVSRNVTAIRGEVRPGLSGGPASTRTAAFGRWCSRGGPTTSAATACPGHRARCAREGRA